jgi:hypothetical protein
VNVDISNCHAMLGDRGLSDGQDSTDILRASGTGLGSAAAMLPATMAVTAAAMNLVRIALAFVLRAAKVPDLIRLNRPVAPADDEACPLCATKQ